MNDHVFMVYVEDGQPPTTRHATLELARVEAERLAIKTGRKVYVLSDLDSCRVASPPVVWSRSGGVSL